MIPMSEDELKTLEQRFDSGVRYAFGEDFLERFFATLRHYKKHVDELQARNTALLERARAAEAGDVDAYQATCERTWPDHHSPDQHLGHFAMGLAEEAGEAAGYVKKRLYYGAALDLLALKKELGDVLWYASSLAKLVDIKMSDVLKTNLSKLKARYPQAWSQEDAAARKDETNA